MLRTRKRVAAARAGRALDALTPSGGNPLAEALRLLEGGAWLSQGAARAGFVQDLTGAGAAVVSTLERHADRCAGEAGVEPLQVDVEDPRVGWKASAARIDGRVARSGHGVGAG